MALVSTPLGKRVSQETDELVFCGTEVWAAGGTGSGG